MESQEMHQAFVWKQKNPVYDVLYMAFVHSFFLLEGQPQFGPKLRKPLD